MRPPEYICDRCDRPHRPASAPARIGDAFDGTCTCRTPIVTPCHCSLCRAVGARVRTGQLLVARIVAAQRRAA